MRTRLLVIGAALLLTACSSMDEVSVLHGCPDTVEVVVTHRNAIEPDGAEQEYWDQTYRQEAPSGRITTAAGIVNLHRHDLILVAVEGSAWELELSTSQLRAQAGPIEIPLDACPEA